MSSLYTILNDLFAGTAGTSVVSHAPGTPNGSDPWTAGNLGEGGMALAAGGGITSTGTGPNWSCACPLTGVTGGIGTYTFVFKSASSSGLPTWYLRNNSTGAFANDIISIVADYPNQRFDVDVVSGGSTVMPLTSFAATLAANTTYTLAVTVTATTVSATLDGTALFGPVTIPAFSGSLFYLRQQLGAAGDVTFVSVQITTPGPDSATVTGPTALTVGTPSTNYTITLDSPVPAGGQGITFTPAPSGFAATPSPSTVTIASGSSSGTFTEDATSAGNGTVSVTPSAANVSGLSVTGQIGVTAGAAGPTSATFSGPSTGTAGVASTGFTITLNVAAPAGGTAVALSDGGVGGVFAGPSVSGLTLTIPAGQAAGTFTYDAASAGAKTITPTSAGIAFTPTSLAYTAGAAPVPTYTFTGPSPSSGFANNASGLFTVTPGASYTGTITVGLSGGGLSGSITKTFSASSTPQTFTILPTAAGTVTLTPVNDGGLANPSALAYTVNAQTLSVSPASVTPSSSGTLTFTAGGGKYLTAAPTFGPAGVAGFSLGAVTVVDDTTATAPYTAGPVTGTETFTDSTTSATATLPVSSASNQLKALYATASLTTVYFILLDLLGRAWNGTGFEALSAGHWASYAIDGSDAGGVGIYLGTIPAAIPAQVLTSVAYVRAGSSPAGGDTPLGSETQPWDGTAFGPLTPDRVWALAYAAVAPLFQPTVVAATGTSITLSDADAASAAGALAAGRAVWVQVTGGTGAFQDRQLASREGTTSAFAVAAWDANGVPTTDSTYQLYSGDPATAAMAGAQVFSGTGGIVAGRPNGQALQDMRAVLMGQATVTTAAPPASRQTVYKRDDGTPAVTFTHDATGNRYTAVEGA